MAVPNLRLKSLKAIVGHILQTLPTSDGKLCEPLSLDYMKSLIQILSYGPHLEHLPQEDWNNAVSLCLEGIHASFNVEAETSDTRVSSFSLKESTSGSTLGTSFGGRSPRTRGAEGNVSSFHVDCLLQCLARLTSAASFPLLDVSQQVLDVIFEYLRSGTTSAGILEAFNVINACLQVTTVDALLLTEHLMRQVVPFMRDQWAKSDFQSRNEMLCCFVQLQPHLLHLMSCGNPREFTLDLEGLYESLIDDYFQTERRGSAHLQLEDLRLITSNSKKSSKGLMQTSSFSLRKHTISSEHNWTLLCFMSFLAARLDTHQSRMEEERREDRENDSGKRRKKSSKVDDLLSQIASDSATDRINAMQIIVFIFSQAHTNEDNLGKAVELFALSSKHSSPIVSSWAMLGLTRSVALGLRVSSTDLDSASRLYRLLQASSNLING